MLARLFSKFLWLLIVLLPLSLHAEQVPGEPKLIKTYRVVTADAYPADYVWYEASVALSGKRLAVGAYAESCDTGLRCGAVYIFERNDSGQWVKVAKLTGPSTPAESQFGNAVALDGNTLVVGAPWLECSESNACGAVYIYKRDDNGQWLLKQSIEPGKFLEFGSAVSLSDGRLAVSAPDQSCNLGYSCGAVYIYEPDATSQYVQVASVVPEAPQSGTSFGRSLSLSGDHLAIGNPYIGDCSSSQGCGAVYVYARDGNGAWLPEATVLGAAISAGLGSSASLSGGRLALGALTAMCQTFDGSCTSVRIYDRNSDGEWLATATLHAAGIDRYADFGRTVTLLGDRLLAGAPGAPCSSGDQCGAAYLFEINTSGEWKQVSILTASKPAAGTFAGASLSLSGDRLAVAAFKQSCTDGDCYPTAHVFELKQGGADYGDAPAPYPTLKAESGAWHEPGFLWLGSSPDAEADGQPEASALGDDKAIVDDDNGISFPDGAVIVNDSNMLSATVGGAAGLLDAWIDYNHDGDWADAGEWVANHLAVVPGSNLFALPAPPAGTATGDTFARFRLSSAGVASPNGKAIDGEVEDYKITLKKPSVTIPVSTVVTEGSPVSFTIKLNSVLDENVTVTYETQNVTAKSGKDYTARAGSYTIPLGELESAPITINTSADSLDEADETFKLVLTSATNVKIQNAELLVTITDDD